MICTSQIEHRFRWSPWNPADNRRQLSSLIRLLVAYGDDLAKSAVKPIMHNGAPAVEVPFVFPIELDTPDGTPYMLCGWLDGLVDLAGDHYTRERKTTTTTLGKYYFRQWNPSVQMDLYDLAGAVKAWPDADVRGVIVEAFQLGVGVCRYDRERINRTARQRAEFLQDVKAAIKTAERDALNGYYPRYSSVCSMYGGCQFQELVCSVDPTQRVRHLKDDFEKRPWNPLAQ